MNLFQAHAHEMAAHQTELGADCPVFTVCNVAYKIIPGSVMRRKDLTPGGLQLNADLSFDVLASQFGVAAMTTCEALLTQYITYLGASYQVEDVRISAGGLQLTVLADSATQNA